MSLNPVNLLKSAVWRTAFAIRESGQALERLGCRLQGIYSYEEIVNRHVPVAPVKYDAPTMGSNAFISPSSLVVGKVELGDSVSVWYNAIVRGDREKVVIGKNSNIQDSAYVGAVGEFSPPVTIGDNVSVGHGAVLKGCKVGSNTLVGIGAVISEGAEVGANTIIAAGSYVEENAMIPSNEVWAGNPAKKLRDLKPAEKDYLRNLPQRYMELSGQHQEIMDLLKEKQEDYTH
mmetsp:Transcript_9283/g.19842  ORF Transcript_9283/g.19842 Transcript_9283/m.19842 type:complete len:232 (-) Transcript_9283:381-1076(-)|eukprot:CAMPEP_0202899822 /NCGR_PEP_ID=MMETSP1392-20130828/8716_1 /ASSEMBLY_ACC=CAM_ASM_000868 /TAXON_ID=225041 /ORGANISM="Chlamydomonas chlamydogama, Strain SAG 11-48b" /LENGTH=231 /DNA_ID=CAMNT_0049586095 /DNA_START=116 /DNA_END=811 /DNA_ORIENTATION=+